MEDIAGVKRELDTIVGGRGELDAMEDVAVAERDVNATEDVDIVVMGRAVAAAEDISAALDTTGGVATEDIAGVGASLDVAEDTDEGGRATNDVVKRELDATEDISAALDTTEDTGGVATEDIAEVGAALDATEDNA